MEVPEGSNNIFFVAQCPECHMLTRYAIFDPTAFKSPELKEEYQEKINKRLKVILLAVSVFCWNSFHKEITITSLIRLDNPHSVHYYGRGADVRSRNFTNEEKIKILNYTNSFLYGKDNIKTCILERFNQKNEHFHIQVKGEKNDEKKT
jgi:hypothetical protein